MKINGRTDDLAQEAVRLTLNKGTATRTKTKEEADRERIESATNSGARVQIALSQAIKAELDPEAMVIERRAKIADLKQRIEDGTYASKSEDVAAALSSEIDSEILSVPRGN